MTREELKAHCERQVKECERYAQARGEKPSGKIYEEHKLTLELLDDEFARWVAEKIFSGMLEEDPELFAELACRRLWKLGIVKAKGWDKWQIVGTPFDDMIKKLESEETE